MQKASCQIHWSDFALREIRAVCRDNELDGFRCDRKMISRIRNFSGPGTPTFRLIQPRPGERSGFMLCMMPETVSRKPDRYTKNIGCHYPDWKWATLSVKGYFEGKDFYLILCSHRDYERISKFRKNIASLHVA